MWIVCHPILLAIISRAFLFLFFRWKIKVRMVKLFTELMSDVYLSVRERKRTWSQFNFSDPFIFTDHMILYVTSELKQSHLFCQGRDSCLLDHVLSSDSSWPKEPMWILCCIDPAKAGPLGQGLWPSWWRRSSIKELCFCCHSHWLSCYLPENFVLQSWDSRFCLIQLGHGSVRDSDLSLSVRGSKLCQHSIKAEYLQRAWYYQSIERWIISSPKMSMS